MSLDTDREETFIYEDSDHHNYLLEKLNTLRKNKQFCDVILQVGTQQDVYEIYGHRAILASASRYFLDIFTTDSNSASVGVPQIQLYKLLSSKYDVDAFNYLLEFIYTSRLEIPKRHVRNVYALASRLKMNSVAQKCGEFLASTLTPDSCLTIRSINGVLGDPILLNQLDNFIKERASEVIKCKYVEKLDKIKIEVLQNSDQEIDHVNPRHLFTLISEWIRKEFSENRLTCEQLLMKTYMLYLNNLDRSLHDCLDIENSDHNYSEVVHEYKSLSRKLSTTKRSTENVSSNSNGKHHMNNNKVVNDQEFLSSSNCNLSEFLKENSVNHVKDLVVQNLIKNNNNHQKNVGPTKPKQFLFTRSDSDSSLSSIADDDEQDWKILAIDTNGSKNNLNGLVMIAGKIYLLSVKLKIHSPHATRNNSLEKPEIYTTISLMNNVRCSLGSACLNGKLIAVGGYNRSEVLKTVEMYDSSTNKWTYLEPMKVARARFNVCVIDDKVYAIGGSDGLKELNSAEVYDSKENKWRSIKRCPIERSNAGVCPLNGLVYVIGGWNSGHNGLSRCDVYDPATDEWSRIADLNVERYQNSVCVLNGKIYVAGGCNFTCLNSVERYDPEIDTWELIEPMQVARRGCGLVSFENKIWVYGGHDGLKSLASCEIFDPKENTWSKGPSLQQCRANVAVTVVDQSIWVIGGFNGKQFLNTCEYLDVKNNEFTNFLKKDMNGNLKLMKEKTLTNEDDVELNDRLNSMKIRDEEVKQESQTNGDRKESRKEALIEVEGEKMDEH